MTDLLVRFRLRRDTSVNWTNANPILGEGEQGYESDTNKIKIGNGSIRWTSLPYFTGSSSDATSGTSVSGSTITLDAGKPGTSYALCPNLELGGVTGVEDTSFMRTLIYAAFI